MLTIFLRAVILYLISVVAVRLMGKRQIGQLQPYELVAAILIADLAAGPMAGAETPLLYGVIPIAALVLLHSAAGLAGMKSPAFRRLLNGSARILVLDGSIRYEELRRVCMTVSDLLEMIRAKGILDICEVGTAILETNGVLSVFPRAANRPVTPEDLQLRVQEDKLPCVLIADGDYRQAEIEKAGLTRESLDAFLQKQGVKENERVLLCSLNAQRMLFLQLSKADSQGKCVMLGEGKV